MNVSGQNESNTLSKPFSLSHLFSKGIFSSCIDDPDKKPNFVSTVLCKPTPNAKGADETKLEYPKEKKLPRSEDETTNAIQSKIVNDGGLSRSVSWNPSTLLHQDPCAFERIRKLSDLIAIFKATRHRKKFQTRFIALREDLFCSCRELHRRNWSLEKTQELDELYERMIKRTRKLVHLAEMPEDLEVLGIGPYMRFMPPYDTLFRETYEYFKAESLRNGVHSSSNKSRALENMFMETRFEAYMREWLRIHWNDPVADEAELLAISEATGFEIDFVNEWLEETRNKEWTPARKKAYELGRPSYTREEDSFNIYCGKPLRALPPSVKVVKRPPLYPGPRKKVRRTYSIQGSRRRSVPKRQEK